MGWAIKVDENLLAKRKDWRPVYNPLGPLCIHLSLCILLATTATGHEA